MGVHQFRVLFSSVGIDDCALFNELGSGEAVAFVWEAADR